MLRLTKTTSSVIGAASAMAVIYATVAIAVTLLAATGKHTAIAWPGFALAVILCLRIKAFTPLATGLGVLAGTIVLSLVHGAAPAVALAVGIMNGTGVVAAIAFVKLVVGDSAHVTTPRQFGMILLAMMGVSLINSIVFGIIVTAVSPLTVAQVAANRFLSDLVGIALVAPIGLTVTRRRLAALMDVDRIAPTASWASLCAATVFLFQTKTNFPISLALVPLMIAATRLNPLSTAITTAAFVMASINAVISGQMIGMPELSAVGVRGFQLAISSATIITMFASLLVSQLAQERRLITQSDQRHRRAMHDSAVGMVNVSTTGLIIDANPAYARLLGKTVREVEGHHVSEFTPPEDRHIGEAVLEQVRRGEIQSGSFEKRFLRGDGDSFWTRITFTSVPGGAPGMPEVLIAQVEDIDSQRKTETELEELRLQWDFALASTGQGFWEFNRDKDTTSYSPSWSKMLGYAPGEVGCANEDWLDLIHPDDRNSVEAMDIANRSGKVPHFEYEYRIRKKSGEWLWVLDRGKVIERTKGGEAQRIIGTLTDITARKTAELSAAQAAADLAEEKERLNVTLQSIGDAVICVDAHDRVIFINHAAEELTQVPAAKAIGKPLAEVYQTRGEQLEFPDPADNEIFRRSKILRQPNGGDRVVREINSPILSRNGQQTGQVIVFHDISDMRALQLKLQHAASHDGLTGLKNRAGFVALLENQTEAPMAPGLDNHLLYIDLDRFKAVNDTAGHAAGDKLLTDVSRAIESALRPNDVVARLGGDEFGVLVRNCPPSFAQLAAQVIVDSIATLDFAWEGQKLTIGASIGVAAFNGSSIDETMARADAACYVAKTSGGGVRIEKSRPQAPAKRRKTTRGA